MSKKNKNINLQALAAARGFYNKTLSTSTRLPYTIQEFDEEVTYGTKLLLRLLKEQEGWNIDLDRPIHKSDCDITHCWGRDILKAPKEINDETYIIVNGLNNLVALPRYINQHLGKDKILVFNRKKQKVKVIGKHQLKFRNAFDEDIKEEIERMLPYVEDTLLF